MAPESTNNFHTPETKITPSRPLRPDEDQNIPKEVQALHKNLTQLAKGSGIDITKIQALPEKNTTAYYVYASFQSIPIPVPLYVTTPEDTFERLQEAQARMFNLIEHEMQGAKKYFKLEEKSDPTLFDSIQKTLTRHIDYNVYEPFKIDYYGTSTGYPHIVGGFGKAFFSGRDVRDLYCNNDDAVEANIRTILGNPEIILSSFVTPLQALFLQTRKEERKKEEQKVQKK